MIDGNQIKRLAQVSTEWCVSLYVPKRKQGEQFSLDHLTFNRILAEAKELLSGKGFGKEEVAGYVQRARDLLDREHFYHRFQPGMLAVFLTPDKLELVDIPVQMEEMVYVGKEFYLRPILSLFNDLERYLILVFTPRHVYLYEGTLESLTQAANLTPKANEEERERVLSSAQGEIDDTGKLFLKTYFRRIDDALLDTVDQRDVPLIIAGPESLAKVYREISRYPNILNRTISFNPESDDSKVLLPRARPIVEEYMRERKLDKRRSFVKEMLRGNASISLTDILAAAVNGKVASLFLDKDEYTTGEYKPAIQWAKVDEKPAEDHTALFNLAAINTFLQGGEVYNLERHELPDSTTSINATFRS